MSEINFPKRFEDGSFRIYARFNVSEQKVLPLIRDYVKAWLRANSPWTRIWRSNVIAEERLDFYTDFNSEPRIENGGDGASFSIVFEGKPSSKHWKDWTVHLVRDVTVMFNEVKFDRFDS